MTFRTTADILFFVATSSARLCGALQPANKCPPATSEPTAVSLCVSLIGNTLYKMLPPLAVTKLGRTINGDVTEGGILQPFFKLFLVNRFIVKHRRKVPDVRDNYRPSVSRDHRTVSYTSLPSTIMVVSKNFYIHPGPNECLCWLTSVFYGTIRRVFIRQVRSPALLWL